MHIKFSILSLFLISHSLVALESRTIKLRTTDGALGEVTLKELDEVHAWYYRDLFDEHGKPKFTGSDKEISAPFDSKTYHHYYAYMRTEFKHLYMQRLTPIQRGKLANLIYYLIVPRSKDIYETPMIIDDTSHLLEDLAREENYQGHEKDKEESITLFDSETYHQCCAYMKAEDKRLYMQKLTPEDRKKLVSLMKSLAIGRKEYSYDSAIIDEAAHILVKLTRAERGEAILLPGIPECFPPVEAILRREWDVHKFYKFKTLQKHTDSVNSVAWSPTGDRLASASNDRTVRIWDGESGKQLQVLHGHDSWVYSVAWSPRGDQLASGSGDGTMRIWDVESGKQLQVLRGHEGCINSVAWSLSGDRLASGSSDRTVRIWNVESGEQLKELQGHGGCVNSIAWSPSGDRLASGSSDSRVRIWNVESGEQLQILRGHEGFVNSVAWSPSGNRLASGSSDRTVRIWDVESGKQLKNLRTYYREVYFVAWSPSGDRLASRLSDGTVQIWDVESGEQLQRLHEYGRGIFTIVAWSPKGDRLALGAEDKTVRIWKSDRDLLNIRQLSFLLGSTVMPKLDFKNPVIAHFYNSLPKDIKEKVKKGRKDILGERSKCCAIQ